MKSRTEYFNSRVVFHKNLFCRGTQALSETMNCFVRYKIEKYFIQGSSFRPMIRIIGTISGKLL